MRLVVPLLLCLAAGCSFRVTGLQLGDGFAPDASFGAGDLLGVDAAADAAVADGAAADDFTVVDLVQGAPDLIDPCGPTAPVVGAAVSVRCIAGTTFTIDGDPTDWGDLTGTRTLISRGSNSQYVDPADWGHILSTDDDADSSAYFTLRWDPSYLYILSRVQDDIRGVYPAMSAMPYRDDAIELYFDGLDDRTTSYGADDLQLIITADARLYAYSGGVEKPAPTGITFATLTVAPADYRVEIKIPWSALGGGTGANGRQVGFDFAVDDDDSTTQHNDHTLMWRKGTSGGPSGCSGFPYCAPSVFGTLQLNGR